MYCFATFPRLRISFPLDSIKASAFLSVFLWSQIEKDGDHFEKNTREIKHSDLASYFFP